MPNNSFIVRQAHSKELESLPHVKEFGLRKNNTVKLDSFEVSKTDALQIYFVVDGKFEWLINKKHHILFPGDAAVVLPGQEIGGVNGYLGIGTLFWLHVHTDTVLPDDRLILGKWSRLSASESLIIGKILLQNGMPVVKVKEAACIFQELQLEFVSQEIGYLTRVNSLLDSLLILISRQKTRQAVARRDFPQTFLKLEESLRQNLAHQWTVEEMAAMVGLGSTAFTERVKSFTGFPPLHYLINIRIAEAIKLLKRSDTNITDIALDTGFYSSQHFSSTFKKLTGYTPNEFRKRNVINEVNQ